MATLQIASETSSAWVTGPEVSRIPEMTRFLVYDPGPRARDSRGVRIYAEVTTILTAGEKLEAIRKVILEKHGAEKASELQATATCKITRVRPIVDRGQRWDEPPFGEG